VFWPTRLPKLRTTPLISYIHSNLKRFSVFEALRLSSGTWHLDISRH
jgi:hypothetical protein